MKKIFLVLLFFHHFDFLFSTDFPLSSPDYAIEMTLTNFILREGDYVGYAGSDEVPSTIYGLFWSAAGITIQKKSSSGHTNLATPMQIDKFLRLNTDVYLVLLEDLYLADDVFLGASGRIEPKYGAIVLSGNFNLLDNTITFIVNYNAKIYGNNNVIDFSKGGQFIFEPDNKNMAIDGVYLKGLKGRSILFYHRERNLDLNNCVIQMDGDTLFDSDVFIHGDVFVTGSGFSCCFNKQIGVHPGGRLIFDYGTTFSLGSSGLLALGLDGTFYFKGCNIEIGDSQFSLDNGHIIFEDEVHINDNSNNKNFLVQELCQVTVLSGARVILEGTTTFSFYG